MTNQTNEAIFMTIENQDFIYNASLDKMTIGEMVVGKKCYINVPHNPAFGEITGFCTASGGELGLVVIDEHGETRQVHNDWIYHHPAIIERSDEFYSFMGEVIIVNWGSNDKEKAICVFCMVDVGPQFKLINMTSFSDFPNRMSDCVSNGIKDENGKYWISKRKLKEVTKGCFEDIEFTGKTLKEYFDQE